MMNPVSAGSLFCVLIGLFLSCFVHNVHSLPALSPEKDVHFFYYIWYGTPDEDGSWKHWDHEVLPHWTPAVNKNYPSVGTYHTPPSVIHSPYYPFRNPYSSRNYDVILQQFNDMTEAGGNVAVVSWWGQESKSYSTDTQGVCTDKVIGEILKAADDYGKIKIAFHLEPYPGRNAETVRDDLVYIIEKYGNHSSFYRAPDGRPLFYVYDSYHIFPSQWRRLLQPGGDITVRGTNYDGWFIGLWLDVHHGRDAKEGGFDGIYTYFATDGFSFGSTTSNWASMCEYAHEQDMMCILSVGPGYNDTSIRPWNSLNVRDRRDGKYYEEMWMHAIAANPSHVSITSFNEWGEGTQIEAARTVYPEERYNKSYLDYGERGPFKYLHITDQFSILLKGPRPSHHDLHQDVAYLHDLAHDLEIAALSAPPISDEDVVDSSAVKGENQDEENPGTELTSIASDDENNDDSKPSQRTDGDSQESLSESSSVEVSDTRDAKDADEVSDGLEIVEEKGEEIVVAEPAFTTGNLRAGVHADADNSERAEDEVESVEDL